MTNDTTSITLERLDGLVNLKVLGAVGSPLDSNLTILDISLVSPKSST